MLSLLQKGLLTVRISTVATYRPTVRQLIFLIITCLNVLKMVAAKYTLNRATISDMLQVPDDPRINFLGGKKKKEESAHL